MSERRVQCDTHGTQKPVFICCERWKAGDTLHEQWIDGDRCIYCDACEKEGVTAERGAVVCESEWELVRRKFVVVPAA